MSKTQRTMSAATARIKQQLDERLQAVRVIVERDPQCGQAKRLRNAEQRLFDLNFKAVGDDLDFIERALRERAEQQKVSAGTAETVELAKARHETVEVEKDGQTRILNRDGLLWLKQKKRLEPGELAALERYRELFGRVHAGPVGSGWDSSNRGNGLGPKVEIRTQAVWELDSAREAVGRDEALVRLLDQVAGMGETLRDLARGNKDVVVSLEAELRVAARLLAKLFGYRS